jgi:hypothetical protein
MIKKPTISDAFHVVSMVIACTISYAVMTTTLVPFVTERHKLLGGMWSVVSTIVVVGDTRNFGLKAAWQRLLATSISFLLCLAYLLMFPFSALGLATVIGIGTIVLIVIDQREDIIATSITSSVVLVVTAIAHGNTWTQPILRLVGTLVGIIIGVLFTCCASLVSSKLVWRSRH